MNQPDCLSSDKCNLWKSVNTPFIKCSGSKTPEILFVGEAPDADDDYQGANLVGDSGKTLRNMLQAIGFNMGVVAFSTVVKCRTTKQGYKGIVNRAPENSEVNKCKNHVIAEISVLKPKIVVLLGSAPLKGVLNKSGITNQRGREFIVDGITYVPTFSPSALLYDESKKEPLLEDLAFVYELWQKQSTKTVQPVSYYFLNSLKHFDVFLSKLTTAEELAFDTETSCLKPFQAGAKIVAVSFSMVEREAFVIPLYHNKQMFFEGRKLAMVKGIIKDVMESDIPKDAQNGKFDIQFLEVTEGIKVKNLVHDTILAEYLRSEERGTHDLDYLAWKYTDMGGYSDGLAQYVEKHSKECDAKKGGSYANIPWEELHPYAAGDADCTLRVKHKQQEFFETGEIW